METRSADAGRHSTSHLRLVPKPKAKPRTAGRTSAAAASEAACRSLFQVAAVAFVTLTLLSLARVALSAKVAEAAVTQVKLEQSIRDQNRVADKLELDKSLLVTPSRIESMAVGLQMTKAPAVRYLTLPAAAPAQPAEVSRGDVSAPMRGTVHALAGMLGVAVDVTQKEARTLLVGDVGVAASR